MFNFPKCPQCGNTLPIATGVCAFCPISPLPGQEDQSARLAASAEVGQVEGTTSMLDPGDCIAFAMVALLESRSMREQALNFLMLELEGRKQGCLA